MAVDYGFYQDAWRGTLPPEAFAEVLPAAESHVAWLCAGASGNQRRSTAYRRAVCAAADVFAAMGACGAPAFSLGDFRVGSTGATSTAGSREPAEVATEAALRELSGTGLAFGGAR